MYRNDGVDIAKDEQGYYVNWMEDGEWLQYSIEVKKAGKYSVSLIAAPDSTGGIAVLKADDKEVGTFSIPNQGDYLKWKPTKSVTVSLSAGMNRFRVYAKKGGFVLRALKVNSL